MKKLCDELKIAVVAEGVVEVVDALEVGHVAVAVGQDDPERHGVDPAAVADAKGRVWVAWQGWRNGRAAILSATQDGDQFSKPAVVASSGAATWRSRMPVRSTIH